MNHSFRFLMIFAGCLIFFMMSAEEYKLERQTFPKNQVELYYAPPMRDITGDVPHGVYSLFPRDKSFSYSRIFKGGYPVLTILGDLVVEGDTILLIPKVEIDRNQDKGTYSLSYIDSLSAYEKYNYHLPRKCFRESDSVMITIQDRSARLPKEACEELRREAAEGNPYGLEMLSDMLPVIEEKLYRIPDFYFYWPLVWELGPRPPQKMNPDAQFLIE